MNMHSRAMSMGWGGCISLKLGVYLKFSIAKKEEKEEKEKMQEEKEKKKRRRKGDGEGMKTEEANWTYLLTNSISGKRKKVAERVF